ncbi:MAG: AraC family transcriptional regulator [Bacteroidales bacterium]|nr:AraC family transcriptional regulator [Bacteroidales bacterium]
MQFELRLDIFALFILLGLSQGVFLIYFYLLKKKRQELHNLFFAFLLITFFIILSEIFLNYTGLIVKVIRIENYSEAFVFLPMPLLYLILKARTSGRYSWADHVHFFPFIFYFLYCFLYFIQPDEFKYNSYVYCYQPDWSYIDAALRFNDDPLTLRKSLSSLYVSQFLVYLYLMFFLIWDYRKNNPEKSTQNASILRYWSWHLIHSIFITVLVIYVKLTYERDLGDFIIGTYIALILYVSGFVTLARNFNPKHTPEVIKESPKPKYEKSSLSEEKKNEILAKLVQLFEGEKYFTNNIISLTDTAKTIGEASHHVSQVINEKLGKSFFDILSEYRTEEAKRKIAENSNLTIEEIAEQVGYNSKAAFNKAFKSYTGKTPSEYRRNLNFSDGGQL